MSAPPRVLSPAEANQRARRFLIGSAAVTALLYVVPYGHTVGYPLMLLSTLAHEMGHGIAAVFIGGHFDEFRMFADGSGRATSLIEPTPLKQAAVAAGGLVGPAVVAAFGFLMGRTPERARKGLVVVGAGLALALLLVVRGLFGMGFVAVTAALCLVIALRARPWVSQVTILFIAVQLALSVFSRGDYLFTDRAVTAEGVMASDVAQMAEALWLPYWFWGALCGLFSVAVLALGVLLLWRAPAARSAA